MARRSSGVRPCVMVIRTSGMLASCVCRGARMRAPIAVVGHAGLERALVVGAGGFLGAAARYLVGGLVHRWLPATFPYGTFLINFTGCFAIGVLAALAEEG